MLKLLKNKGALKAIAVGVALCGLLAGGVAMTVDSSKSCTMCTGCPNCGN